MLGNVFVFTSIANLGSVLYKLKSRFDTGIDN